MVVKTMTEGAPWKHIILFAVPVLLGAVLQQLYNTVDTIIVGNFASELSLSAVGTTGTLTYFLLTLAIGFSAGNGVLVAQYFGAKNENKLRSTAANGIVFLLELGLVISILGIIFARPAFKYVVNVPDEILDSTVSYFRIYSIGLIFQYGYNIFSSILRGVGDSASTLYFLLISSVLNIGLDLLFVAVLKMDVNGAAIATVISQVVCCGAALVYMVKKYSIFRFKKQDFAFDGDAILKTVKIGFPICFQQMVVSLGLTAIQRAVNGFGQVMTASFTVGQRMEMYINIPAHSFQTTLATYTGQNLGAQKLDRIKKGAKQTVLISVIFTMIISALIWIFANQLTGFFGLSEQAAVYCNSHLKTIAFINIVLSMYVPLFGLYQGMGHTKFLMLVSICALGTRILVTYLFKDTSFFGYTIIWWNGIFGFGIGCLVTWGYYISKRWARGVGNRPAFYRSGMNLEIKNMKSL